MNKDTRYKKTKSHIEDTAKLILVLNYMNDGIDLPLNQLSIAGYLKVIKLTIFRHLSKLRDYKLITKVRQEKLKNGRWLSNIYEVDETRLNEYILNKTGENVLEHINDYTYLYYDYKTFVVGFYNDNEHTITLSEEEIQKRQIKSKKKAKNQEKKLNQLKKKNTFYIDTLSKVNNTIIPMSYLEDNRKRLTNSLCATKNPNNKGHENDKARYNLLEQYFGTRDLEEFDTNASIYRLSWALGHKNILGHNEDIYEKVYKECNFKEKWTPELRSKFKLLLMPIYMKESSIKYKCSTMQYMLKWKFFTLSSNRKFFEFYKYFIDLFKMDLYDILDTVRNAMHKIFNLDIFYKANIFIHESNLHIIMIKLFKDMGIQTINVYDGFYFKKGEMNQELYNEVYDKATSILLANLDRDTLSFAV